MFYNYVTLDCFIRVNDCSIKVSQFLNIESALSHLVPLVLCQYVATDIFNIILHIVINCIKNGRIMSKVPSYVQ